MLETLRWEHGLVDLSDHVPELWVLLVENDHDATGLGIEGAGKILDRGGDELLDARIRDNGRVIMSIIGASILDGFEEVHLVGHFDSR